MLTKWFMLRGGLGPARCSPCGWLSLGMLYKTISASVYGIDAYPVEVEVDVGSAYMNDFNVVGLPDNAVKESRERIKSALHKLWIRISPRAGSDHQPGA